MQNILNITNGDCAVDVMKKAKIPGDFLPWRDVLHDGPVPEGFSLESLSQIRSEFITSQGWGSAEDITRDFIERDKILKLYNKYDKVILWFEHDLYDQLQILQILDWFYLQGERSKSLTLICEEKYLGTLSADEIKLLLKDEKSVSNEQLKLASQVWAAFRSSNPECFSSWLNKETTQLPFLADAIHRMLEEFPNIRSGLSRTAKQALSTISQGEKCAVTVFEANQALEDRIFLGDSSFLVILQAFLNAKPPLLSMAEGQSLTTPFSANQVLSITQTGNDVLAEKCHWLEIVKIDQWIGGVHLTPDNIWCWDGDTASLVKYD